MFRFKRTEEDSIENRFQAGVELVKDMNAEEFDKFLCGLDLAWQAYDAMRSGQQANSDDIENLEREMSNE